MDENVSKSISNRAALAEEGRGKKWCSILHEASEGMCTLLMLLKPPH